MDRNLYLGFLLVRVCEKCLKLVFYNSIYLMISIGIFLTYLSAFSYLVIKITKKQLCDQNWKLLLVAFLFKVLFGCFYGIYHKQFIPLADTWNYYFNGLKLNQTNWAGFLSHNRSSNPDNIIIQAVIDYYRFELMDAVSAIFNLMTGGRYFLNVILYNFIIFWGIVRLYLFMLKVNPDYKKVLFLALFFFPPFVFWTSGIHKDGLCIALLGVFLFSFDSFLSSRVLKSAVVFLIAAVCLVFIKSYWGLSALIGAGLWWIAAKSKKLTPALVFSLGFLLLAALFAITAFFPPSINFVQSIVHKQHKFLSLSGGSELPITTLSMDLGSYLRACLDALNHLLCRPYLNELRRGPLYAAVFFENLFVWILALLSVYYVFRKNPVTISLQKPQNNVLLFLVLVNYLIIGLTVPFLGAIARYKAPFEMLLILVLVQLIPAKIWNKLLPFKI